MIEYKVGSWQSAIGKNPENLSYLVMVGSFRDLKVYNKAFSLPTANCQLFITNKNYNK